MVAMVAVMVVVVVVAVDVVVVEARIQHQQVRRLSTHTQVTKERQAHSFSCKGKTYGYYADPATACQVFHICFPHLSPDGSSRQVLQWSFTCPGQTVFNQNTLTCTSPGKGVLCGELSDFYFTSDAKDEM